MSATMTAPVETTERAIAGPSRVLSVDVLRGLTIAFMILVNDPGDWSQLFSPLDHAEWNGWTMTDLVFPTFLFLVGASLIFSIESRIAKGNCRKTMSGQVLWRTVKILLLQFVLVFFPRMHWHHLRFFGVLPRIALCYLIAGLIVIAVIRSRSRTRILIGIVAGLLLGYWALMRWLPVPGSGLPLRDVPLLDPVHNLAAWLDRAAVQGTQRWLHTGSLYKKTSDPEGLLSTLPAVATTLLGALAAIWMRHGVRSLPVSTREPDPSGPHVGRQALRRMQAGLALAGAIGVAAGELWSLSFPVNKNLWTSSYVLLAAGWAAIALAALSWLMDGRPEPWPRWLQAITWPWFVFGSNAIAAFTVSAVLVKGALYFHVADGADRVSVWEWIYSHWFARVDSTKWTSLAFAISFVLVCFLPNWWLWRKKWFLKI